MPEIFSIHVWDRDFNTKIKMFSLQGRAESRKHHMDTRRSYVLTFCAVALSLVMYVAIIAFI